MIAQLSLEWKPTKKWLEGGEAVVTLSHPRDTVEDTMKEQSIVEPNHGCQSRLAPWMAGLAFSSTKN